MNSKELRIGRSALNQVIFTQQTRDVEYIKSDRFRELYNISRFDISFTDRVSFGIYSSHTVYGTKSEIITRHRTPPIQEFEDCVRFIHSDLFIAIHKICDQSIHYIVLSGQRG
eukprot:440918_1